MGLRKWLAIGALAAATYFGYKSCNENEVLQPKPDNYDHGSFILHMKDGKGLGDVDAFEENLAYLKKGPFTRRILQQTPEKGTTLDDAYVVDPLTHHDKDLDSIMEEVAKDDDVERVEYNMMFSIDPIVPETTTPQDGEKCYSRDTLCDKMWGMNAHGVEDAHAFLRSIPKPKKRAIVYVLDTGSVLHEDLPPKVNTLPSKDGNGHGTHCAGTIAGVSNNDKGVFSASPNSNYVELRSIKVLTNFGWGSLSRIAKGIYKATNDGADVISMSLGGRSNSTPQVLVDAIKYAQSKNAIVVAAAGNSDADTREFFPAGIEGVISVSAADENLNRADFSNYYTDITATGVNIWSTLPNKNKILPDKKYGALKGTSMACPHVAGAIGTSRSIDNTLTSTEFVKYATAKENSIIIKTDENKPVGPMPHFGKLFRAVYKKK